MNQWLKLNFELIWNLNSKHKKAYDDMMQKYEIQRANILWLDVSYLGCYKTPPLKESRPEIPTEK